jgi:hypothetical protein
MVLASLSCYRSLLVCLTPINLDMSPYYAIGLLALAANVVAAPAPPALSTPQGLSASSYKSIPSQGSTSMAASAPAPSVVSSQVTGRTTHGPYRGPAPTTTGALSLNVLAPSIAPAPPLPLTYPSDGQLHSNQPAPYIPHGGLGTNGTPPEYVAKSDFDYESLALALYQEWIELDLFHWGLARFSVADFEDAGLTAADRFLIQFMADQEVGHATVISNMLGPKHAPKQCTYNYPCTTVRGEFIMGFPMAWAPELIFGLQSSLISRKIHPSCYVTSLILIFPTKTKADKVRRVGRLRLFKPPGFS